MLIRRRLSKIANRQIGVFSCYASPRSFVTLERALQLRHSGHGDLARWAQAGIPAKIAFQDPVSADDGGASLDAAACRQRCFELYQERERQFESPRARPGREMG